MNSALLYQYSSICIAHITIRKVCNEKINVQQQKEKNKNLNARLLSNAVNNSLFYQCNSVCVSHATTKRYRTRIYSTPVYPLHTYVLFRSVIGSET